MARKFMAVSGLVLLYLAVWSLLLLPVLLLIDDQDQTTPLVIVAVLMILLPVLFVPYLNWAIRRVYVFRGEGAPVAAAALRDKLLAINAFDVPVAAREHRGRLSFTWRYADARWWEVLARAGLQQVYECRVKLDERKHEATLIDVNRSVSWRAGPTEVKLSACVFYGVQFGHEIGRAWGITERFRPGQIYQYAFTPAEIKNPVLNTILEHGWTVRFGFW